MDRTRAFCLALLGLACSDPSPTKAPVRIPGEVEATRETPPANEAPAPEPEMPKPKPESRPVDEPEPLPVVPVWFDAERPDEGLKILCETQFDEDLNILDGACVHPGEELVLLDAEGAETWLVHDSQERIRRPTLEREGGRLPASSALLLATRSAPPPGSTLERRRLTRPSKTARRAARKLGPRLHALDEDIPSETKLEAEAQLEGEFGLADKLVIFRAAYDELEGDGGWAVLVALDEAGEILGVVDDPAFVPAGSFGPAGVVDLDGDGVEEVLWWSTVSGVGMVLGLSRVVEGQPEMTSLYSCQCLGAYMSAFRVDTSVD